MPTPLPKAKRGDTTQVLGRTLTFDGKNWTDLATAAAPQAKPSPGGSQFLEGLMQLPGSIGQGLVKGAANASPFVSVDIPRGQTPMGKVDAMSTAGPEARTPSFDAGQGVSNTLAGLLALITGGAATPLTVAATTAGGMAAPQVGGAIQRRGGGPIAQAAGEIATDVGVTGLVRSPARAVNAVRSYGQRAKDMTKRGAASALRADLGLGRAVADESSRNAVNAIKAKNASEKAVATAAYARVPDVRGGPRIVPSADAMDVADQILRNESPDLVPDVVKRIAAWGEKPGGLSYQDILREIKSINALDDQGAKIADKLLPQLESMMDEIGTKSPEVADAVGKWRTAQSEWAKYKSNWRVSDSSGRAVDSATSKMLVDRATDTPDVALSRVFTSQDPVGEARILWRATAGSPEARESLKTAYARWLIGEDTQSAVTAINRMRQSRGVATTLFGKRSASRLESVLKRGQKHGISSLGLGQSSLLGSVIAQAAGLPWHTGAIAGSGLEIAANVFGPARARKIALAALYDENVMNLLERRVSRAEGPEFAAELIDVAARAGFNSIKNDGESQ